MLEEQLLNDLGSSSEGNAIAEVAASSSCVADAVVMNSDVDTVVMDSTDSSIVVGVMGTSSFHAVDTVVVSA